MENKKRTSKKQRKNYSLSTLAIKQLELMAEKFGIDKTEVVERAIERMYIEENRKSRSDD